MYSSLRLQWVRRATQVALGAARDEERRLRARDFGRVPLERIDGRILAVDVVAHLRLRHELCASIGVGMVTVSLRKSII